jgi:hypothetical protein
VSRQRLTCIVVAFAACVAAAALAPAADARQQTRPAPTPAPARDAATGDNADLSITARVTADSLVFRKVPNPRVEFTGRPRRETVWEAERQNLPEQVQPGVTYRDIGITLRITSIFSDIERIVAEALGEIPLSDDAPPNPPPPSTPPELGAATTKSGSAAAGQTSLHPAAPAPRPSLQASPANRTNAPRRAPKVRGRGK